MEIVNKPNFEHGAPPGVNEYKVPPGVISDFYLSWKLLKVEFFEKIVEKDD